MLNYETEVFLLQEIQKLRKIQNSLAAKQDEDSAQIERISSIQNNNTYKIEILERRDKIRQDRYEEIEYLPNLYSPDGDPICDYYTNRMDEDNEN